MTDSAPRHIDEPRHRRDIDETKLNTPDANMYSHDTHLTEIDSGLPRSPSRDLKTIYEPLEVDPGLGEVRYKDTRQDKFHTDPQTEYAFSQGENDNMDCSPCYRSMSKVVESKYKIASTSESDYKDDRFSLRRPGTMQSGGVGLTQGSSYLRGTPHIETATPMGSTVSSISSGMGLRFSTGDISTHNQRSFALNKPHSTFPLTSLTGNMSGQIQRSLASTPPISTFPPRTLPPTDLYGNYRQPIHSTTGHSQRKPIVMPDKFDGTSVWQDYLTHFEICASINEWNDHQRATFLAVSLRGNAQMLLGDLSVTKLHDYSALVVELQARFGHEGQSELFRTQLKDRSKRPDESFPELGQDIKRLVARAYPDAPTTLQDTLAKDHFVDALVDSDMRLYIYQNKTKSLSQAVQVATEWQAFQRAERHRNGAYNGANRRPIVRSTTLFDDAVARSATLIDDANQIKNMESMHKQISELQMELNHLKNQNRRSSGSYPNTHNRNPRDETKDRRACWACGQTGHFRINCPNSAPAQSQAPSNQHTQQNQGNGL